MEDKIEDEYKESLRRAFWNRPYGYIIMDGHTYRSEFLRNCWNYAVDSGYFRVVEVNLEQDTYMKGYLTDKGKSELL